MSISERIYTLAVAAARPLLPLAARGDGKLARAIRGRRGVLGRMATWADAERDPSRPLVWFHAPSVGEGLQARAVVEALRARRPGLQVAYTYFSPSAEPFARTVAADFADYLPFDLAHDVGRALDLLRPGVLAFSKTDVWPVLTREARARGVRLALLSATLPASSSRLGGVARAVLAPAYARLDLVAAISPADADRFAALGVPPERRTVMGDARFDQVWERAALADRASPLLAPFAGWSGPTLVAGSTWAPDEDNLIAALARLRGEGVPLRLVVAPHEPTEAHLARTEAALRAHAFPHARLSAVEAGAEVHAVTLVDRVGILGDLYALADLAYVGGGFGTAGLHSVLEPAAFGAPVLFGPRHANAREAAELMAAGGAFEVTGTPHLTETLRRLADPAVRQPSGAAARRYAEAGRGAALRGAEIIERLLDLG
jgi:3-deoxy-D-manno-octulosonic-acid transferase